MSSSQGFAEIVVIRTTNLGERVFATAINGAKYRTKVGLVTCTPACRFEIATAEGHVPEPEPILGVLHDDGCGCEGE